MDNSFAPDLSNRPNWVNRLESLASNTRNVNKLFVWLISLTLILSLFLFLIQELIGDNDDLAHSFYRLDAIITVFLISIGDLFLLQVWTKRVEKLSNIKQELSHQYTIDIGLLFLLMTLYFWALSKLIWLFFTTMPIIINDFPTGLESTKYGALIRSSCFLLNSWCLLQSFYYFDNKTKLDKALKFLNIKNYHNFVNVLCLFFGILMIVGTLFPTLVFWKWESYMSTATRILLPLDLFITTPLLFIVLDETYRERGFHILKVLNIIFGITILGSQLFTFPFDIGPFFSVFFLLTMKIVFVINFLSIAYSENNADLENAWEELENKQESNQKELDEQRKQMNHNTKNTLNLLLNDVEYFQNLFNSSDQDNDWFFKYIISRLLAASKLHEELHKSLVGSVIAAKKLISKILEHLKVIFEFGKDNFSINMDALPDDLYLSVFKAQSLGRIIAELVSNICIHAYPGMPPSKRILILDISYDEAEAMIIIVAKDKGVGFDASKIDYTQGYGLAYIKRIVENLKGSFHCGSSPGSGSEFIIKIPIDHF